MQFSGQEVSLGCFGKPVFKFEISADVCSSEFPAVSVMSRQLTAEVNSILFLCCFPHKIHNLPRRVYVSETALSQPWYICNEKLQSYILVKHMPRFSPTYLKRYQVWYRRGCSNSDPIHLKVCALKYTQLIYQFSRMLDQQNGVS